LAKLYLANPVFGESRFWRIPFLANLVFGEPNFLANPIFGEPKIGEPKRQRQIISGDV
jgi:hypothetical protein